MVIIPEYFTYAGKLHRVIYRETDGSWVICCDGKSQPYYIDNHSADVIPAMAPEEEFDVSQKRKKTQEKRKNVIQPLLDNDCIRDAELRRVFISKCSRESGISVRTITRYYWMYLAKGEAGLLPAARERGRITKDSHQYMRSALNKYYYSPAHMSLHMTYEMMLTEFYRTDTGELQKDIPTYNQFEYYYYQNRDIRRCITTREGTVEYKKNYRPFTGSCDDGIENIGIMEMDATEADIYLVSQYDRGIVGRPKIYLAVDVVSRLIAGIYVGFDESATAVLSCLANTARDKVEFCAEYGIEISANEWPSKYLPSMIITDRGMDFIGSRTKEMATAFGIEMLSEAPFMAPQKCIVEQAYAILQQKYKPLLYGCGVIQKNTLGRGNQDYRLTARLDIREFTAVIIQSVLYYNSGRTVRSFNLSPEMLRDEVLPIPSQVWLWYARVGKDSRIKANIEDIELRLLPRGEGRLNNQGISFGIEKANKCFYTNNSLEKLYVEAGVTKSKKVTVAYDPNNIGKAFLVLKNGQYLPIFLTGSYIQYDGLSTEEFNIVREQQKKLLRSAKEKAMGRSLKTNEGIQTIKNNSKFVPHTKEELAEQTIRKHREKERENKENHGN